MPNDLNTTLTDIATNVVLEAFGEYQERFDLFTTEIDVMNVGTHRAKISPTSDSNLTKNGTSFGNEDSQLIKVDVVVDHYSKGGKLTNTDLQNGFKISQIMGGKARGLANGLYGIVTANMTEANFAVGEVASTPAELTGAELATVNGSIESDSTVCLLEPTYHSKFVPTSKDDLALVDGVYGIDRGIRKVSKINHAKTVGFIGSRNSIVLCAGLPVNEADDSVDSAVITLPNGLEVLFATWYDAGAKARKFDFSIIFGSGVGIADEGRVIASELEA